MGRADPLAALVAVEERQRSSEESIVVAEMHIQQTAADFEVGSPGIA